VVKRHDEEVTVRSGLDVGHDPEVTAEHEAFTFSHLVEGQVVGNAIGKPRVVDGDLLAIAGEIEPEQRPAERIGRREADEQVVGVLRPNAAAILESDRRRREDELPAELRVAVVRAW
jgi:hypothetical protein